MLPIKPEPIENQPETNSRSMNYLPYIKSETIEYPQDVKSETIRCTPEIPPTKRLKTLSSASSPPSSKGKSIIEKEEEDHDDSFPDQQLDTCGVCLLEEGMSLRGFIDSCEHYFCFVCIMEWAKVESRCPICKRRFSTIRRPPKDGVFFSERTVNVPVRDQVYHHNGNATVGPSDPYSQVKCSVCSLSTDDELLLLCDLCDSAAHSFCVGLGATVPEGDWFCNDCTLSRDEHAKIETNMTSDNNTPPSASNLVQFAQSNMSINDIIRESSIPPMAANFSQIQPIAERSSVQPSVNHTSNARTLQRCLNVHARIKVLRENWDGFRGGSLSFRDGNKANEQSTSQKHPYNVDRAWKMMEIATMALGKKNGNKSSIEKDSKYLVKKQRLLLNEGSKVRPNGKHFGGPKNNDEKHGFEKPKVMQGVVKNDQNHVESRKTIGFYNGENRSQRDRIGVASIIVGSSDRSSHLIRSELKATDKCCAKKEIDVTFKKGGIKKDPQVDVSIKKLEDAKSEIQSLVKLNLKLLSKDCKLEVNVFKEVARHATHSILGACGIERLKPGFRFFERLVCEHSKRPRSTLMATCCRECFFIFVKDVVTTVADDRL